MYNLNFFALMQRYSHFILIISVISLLTTGCFEEAVETNGDLNGNDNENGEPGEFSHTLNPGESNEAFVTDENYSTLIVEIQFMAGAEPEEEALQNVAAFLEQNLQKEEVILLEPQQIPSLNQNVYNVNDLAQIEENNREYFTDDDQLAAYILIVDGDYLEQDALSVAYFNTSVALFGTTINRISGPQQFDPSKESVEATLIKHQFGHLMGLVNNGTEMVENHHDEFNGAHCALEQCLMNFRINSANFYESFFQNAEFELSQFCIADLEELKNS